MSKPTRERFQHALVILLFGIRVVRGVLLAAAMGGAF